MTLVLMLVWTGVATDTRVLREASALVAAGHRVHVIGRAVPADFVPPDGVSVQSCGVAPSAQTRTRELTGFERLGRWALLPVHVRRRVSGVAAGSAARGPRLGRRRGRARRGARP